MGFWDVYWALSGFLICVPLIFISFSEKHKNNYIVERLLVFCVFFLLINLIESKMYAVISESEIIYILNLILIHILSMFIFKLCNDVNWIIIVYGKIWGLAAYYIAIQLASLITSLITSQYFFEVLIVMKIMINLAISFIIYLIFKRLISENNRTMSVNKLIISGCITLVGVIFNAIIFYFLNSRHYVVYLFQLFSMMVVVLALCLIEIEFQHHRLNMEMEMQKRLWNEQQKQFEIKKDYIELINKKFHDLKHEISAIKYMTNDSAVKEELDEMSRSLQRYNYFVNTGNSVIDTILTEKAEMLINENVRINCIIDEDADISFMKVMDLYRILGNALDNVLECMKGEYKPEQGYVYIRIYKDKEFIRILVKNNYCGEIKFENGLPVSNKKDEYNHGYGIKSINDTVKSYDGALSIRTDNQEFSLNIILHVPIVQ